MSTDVVRIETTDRAGCLMRVVCWRWSDTGRIAGWSARVFDDSGRLVASDEGAVSVESNVERVMVAQYFVNADGVFVRSL